MHSVELVKLTAEEPKSVNEVPEKDVLVRLLS